MKTKINFKALDYADIEFGTIKLSEEEQKEFSAFLAKRKKTKSRTVAMRISQ
jgi:hypothetical protein